MMILTKDLVLKYNLCLFLVETSATQGETTGVFFQGSLLKEVKLKCEILAKSEFSRQLCFFSTAGAL